MRPSELSMDELAVLGNAAAADAARKAKTLGVKLTGREPKTWGQPKIVAPTVASPTTDQTRRRVHKVAS